MAGNFIHRFDFINESSNSFVITGSMNLNVATGVDYSRPGVRFFFLKK